MEYLNERHLSFVQDNTNNEDFYTRNKIRLNVIPLLETINPSVKETISKTAAHLLQVTNIYNLYMSQVTANIFTSNKIDISMLTQYLEPEAILFELLSPYGFNSATIRQVFESVVNQSAPGRIFYSETHELLKDRGFLLLKKKTNLSLESFTIRKDNKEIFYPMHLIIKDIPVSKDFTIEKKTDVLYLDADKIQYPLTVRKWQQGDWFIPFGMKGKKKISDYFSDHKFSLFDKENAWLLCSGDDILWIVGHRSDDRFKITPDTVKALTIICMAETKGNQ
jgi:tRNA(Ile)-lysidine synthase